MTDTELSTVTVSLNSEEDIENAIISVAGQTCKNREYTIIDGGPQDTTVDIIRKHYERLSYWMSEPDNGRSDAFNSCLRISELIIVNFSALTCAIRTKPPLGFFAETPPARQHALQRYTSSLT